jgi:hypothetical protein
MGQAEQLYPTEERQMVDGPDIDPYTGDDGEGSQQDLPSRTPAWLKVVAIAVAIILLGLIVALHLTGAIGPGLHGGRNTSPGGGGALPLAPHRDTASVARVGGPGLVQPW